MSALEWFGLPADAGERDLKRAYARRLRNARPDEDAAAFQQLQVMFELALHEIRDGVCPDEEDTAWDGGVAVDVAPGPTWSVPVLATVLESDIDAMVVRIADFGRRDDAAGLRTWLHAQDVLWSIETGELVSVWILDRLRAARPPIGPRAFAELEAFLDASWASAGIDPATTDAFRTEALVRWYLLPEHADACVATLVARNVVRSQRQARNALRRLSSPFSAWRACAWALVPALPARMWRVLDAMAFDTVGALPPIDAGQARFWARAGNRWRLSVPRTTIGLWRSVVYAGLSLVPFAASLRNPIAFCMTWFGLSLAFAAIWAGVAIASDMRGSASAPGTTTMPAWGIGFGLLFAVAMVRSCAAGG